MAAPRRQRGLSLVEALMAFVVLCLGMVALAQLQARLQANAELARQRSQAMQLALEDMESLRAFTTVGSTSDAASFGAIASASRAIDNGWRLERRIDGEQGLALKSATVSVDWADRAGEAHRLSLPSLIAGTPPALSGALSARSGGPAPTLLRGRSIAIPIDALDLGNGTSMRTLGALTLVFDNTTGHITARCELTADASARAHPDPASCSALDALLLSGWVRFSLGVPPDALHADDSPLSLAIALVLRDSGSADPPRCSVETRAGAVAYHCAIATTGGAWSGRSSVVPQGWNIGSRASEHKVCRYAADRDGSGAIDTNAEHPSDYVHVEQTLMQQNFLVVRGDQPCPDRPDAQTVQHQP
jgi:Tfp pilus assembly protein PilV